MSTLPSAALTAARGSTRKEISGRATGVWKPADDRRHGGWCRLGAARDAADAICALEARSAAAQQDGHVGTAAVAITYIYQKIAMT